MIISKCQKVEVMELSKIQFIQTIVTGYANADALVLHPGGVADDAITGAKGN